MKRITKSIKRLDLYASLVDLVYVAGYGALILHLFMLLAFNPDDITQVLDGTYTLFNGMTLTVAQTNTMISLIVGYLVVFVPTLVGHFKRVFDKETIEIEAWDYRAQVLYALMALFTGNIISSVLRFMMANEEMQIIKSYNLWGGFIALMTGIWHILVKSALFLKNVAVAVAKFFIPKNFVAGFKRLGQFIKNFVTSRVAYYKQVRVDNKAVKAYVKEEKPKVLEAIKTQQAQAKEKHQAEFTKFKPAKDVSKSFKKRYKAIKVDALDEFETNVRDLKIQQLELRSKERKFIQSQVDIEKANKRSLVGTLVGMGITYTFLTFIAIFIFIPFYWMIITALKTHQELSTAINPRFFIGLEEMQWVNWKIAFTNYDFWRYMGNTIFVGLVSMVGTVLTTILAAFAFSRLEFKGREFIFSILLMTMMIPGELYTITNYITVRNLGWYDSFTALIFPFMTSVFYIFFLRQSFKQIPDSLYRAAQVDGCGDFKYLTRVMIPIARPTITTIMILSAIGAWDAYIWPQLVTPSQKYWLISVALRSTSFVTGVGSDARPVYNIQLAATALVTVPLLIIFFSLKKYIIRGVGRSGTKG